MNKYTFAFIILFVSTFINALYASGGVMSTGGFNFSQNDILSAKSITISVVVIVVIVFLLKVWLSSFKEWDKRCYEEKPTAVADIDKEMSNGKKILIAIAFVFYTIICRGDLELMTFAIILIIAYLIVKMIIKFSFYILGLKSAAAKNYISKGFELLFVIGIILILVEMAMPNFRMHNNRESARQKACYSNIRVVQGAVEMYNMDAPLATGSKNIHLFMDKMNMQNLVKGGYLKPGIKCPGIGEDTYTNVGNLDGDGEVSCGKEGGTGISFSNPKLKYHGTLSGR